MTLLGGKALDTKALFSSEGAQRKASSVDLTIGKMLDENGTDLGHEYKLRPGRMVFVVSAEVFDLPANVTGLVSCKTALTHDGVWAITVGIVDPCWTGPVSTTLVNFGANARLLTKGSEFLRVAFFSHEPGEVCEAKDAALEARAYLLAAKRNAVKFPPTFLDQDRLADRAGKKAWSSMRTGALFWGAMLALFLSILQVASIGFERRFLPPDPESLIADRFETLEQRVAALEGIGDDAQDERQRPTQ